MPLVECPECHAMISSTAASCPHCGYGSQPPVIIQQDGTSALLAGLCSFFFPGLGQLLQGRIGMALLMFLATTGLWVVTLGYLGWIGHIIAAIEAVKYSRK